MSDLWSHSRSTGLRVTRFGVVWVLIKFCETAGLLCPSHYQPAWWRQWSGRARLEFCHIPSNSCVVIWHESLLTQRKRTRALTHSYSPGALRFSHEARAAEDCLRRCFWQPIRIQGRQWIFLQTVRHNSNDLPNDKERLTHWRRKSLERMAEWFLVAVGAQEERSYETGVFPSVTEPWWVEFRVRGSSVGMGRGPQSLEPGSVAGRHRICRARCHPSKAQRQAEKSSCSEPVLWGKGVPCHLPSCVTKL